MERDFYVCKFIFNFVTRFQQVFSAWLKTIESNRSRTTSQAHSSFARALAVHLVAGDAQGPPQRVTFRLAADHADPEGVAQVVAGVRAEVRPERYRQDELVADSVDGRSNRPP
eukprot:5585643-Prymnesium_polylepis.1